MIRKEFEKTLGNVIRKLRLQKHLTIEEAAALCNCSTKQWKHYESQGSNSLRTFLKITASLHGSLLPLTDTLSQSFPLEVLKNIPLFGTRPPIKRNINIPEIESALRKEKRPWVKEKLLAILWLGQGMTVKAVTKRLGKRRNDLIQHWLWKYNKVGIVWILNSKKHHAPNRVSGAQKLSTKGVQSDTFQPLSFKKARSTI